MVKHPHFPLIIKWMFMQELVDAGMNTCESHLQIAVTESDAILWLLLVFLAHFFLFRIEFDDAAHVRYLSELLLTAGHF